MLSTTAQQPVANGHHHQSAATANAVHCFRPFQHLLNSPHTTATASDFKQTFYWPTVAGSSPSDCQPPSPSSSDGGSVRNHQQISASTLMNLSSTSGAASNAHAFSPDTPGASRSSESSCSPEPIGAGRSSRPSSRDNNNEEQAQTDAQRQMRSSVSPLMLAQHQSPLFLLNGQQRSNSTTTASSLSSSNSSTSTAASLYSLPNSSSFSTSLLSVAPSTSAANLLHHSSLLLGNYPQVRRQSLYSSSTGAKALQQQHQLSSAFSFGLLNQPAARLTTSGPTAEEDIDPGMSDEEYNNCMDISNSPDEECALNLTASASRSRSRSRANSKSPKRSNRNSPSSGSPSSPISSPSHYSSAADQQEQQQRTFSLLTNSSVLGSSIFPSISAASNSNNSPVNPPSISINAPFALPEHPSSAFVSNQQSLSPNSTLSASSPSSLSAGQTKPTVPLLSSVSLPTKPTMASLQRAQAAPYKPHKWLRPATNESSNNKNNNRPINLSNESSTLSSLSPGLSTRLSPISPTANSFSNSTATPPPNLEIRITRQPAKFHRARYMTEGSRGPIRDKTGKSFPAIRLIGFDEHPVSVFCYLCDDRQIAQPHLFYQASKLSSRCVTSCTEIRLGGTNALQFELQPSQNMELTIDCLGIVKQRLFEIQQNAAAAANNNNNNSNGSSGSCSPNQNNSASLDRGAKSPCCRIVFECYLPKYNHILQTYSDTIHCKQVMRAPEVHRMSTGESHVRGGGELFVIGKNFGKDARILLRMEGGQWQTYAWPEKELLHQTHLVCRVPSFDSSLISKHGECIGGQWRLTVELYILCDGKRSAKQSFTYFE